MPKKKTRETKVQIDQSDSLELASVISLQSDGSETPTAPFVDVGELASQSALDKVCLAVDLMEEKRTETRLHALHSLIEFFRSYHFFLDGSWNYTETLITSIENIFKRSKPQDQALAADLLTVFSLQIDPNEVPIWFERFYHILEPVIRDATTSRKFRASAAIALSVLQSLSGYCDFISPLDVMKSFEFVFKSSTSKIDVKTFSGTDVSDLFVASLKAWTLIYTFLSPFDAGIVGKAVLPTLLSLLQCSNVDVRIIAGEASAVIYERIRSEVDDKFKGPYYSDLVRLLGELATDSSKNRSKIDLKKQRHSFREFVEAIVHCDYPETSINFGVEVLTLSSCTSHFYYNFLCSVLGSGLRRHLRENPYIRNLFDLGLPLIPNQNGANRRILKEEKRLTNAVASKSRTQKLNVHRDKRRGMPSELE
ncbi:Interferon-related developmental regulator 1 [Schistosoma japonicum]|nr:Interferon-related developmental regulator 1 [Schistosoma japonicum]